MTLCIATVKTHKWKSAFLFGFGAFTTYKCTQLYFKFKEGYSEFSKIIKLMDENKKNLPQGEQPEDGTEEEFNFMKGFLDNLNDQADPILKTVITNIQDTERSQRKFILNLLKEELKVEHWQGQTKQGETNKDKIKAWNELKDA